MCHVKVQVRRSSQWCSCLVFCLWIRITLLSSSSTASCSLSSRPASSEKSSHTNSLTGSDMWRFCVRYFLTLWYQNVIVVSLELAPPLSPSSDSWGIKHASTLSDYVECVLLLIRHDLDSMRATPPAPLARLMSRGRSFVRYCGQGSNLLWTPALRPWAAAMIH